MRHHPSAAAQAVAQAWGGVPGHSIGSSADAALLGFADIAHDTRVVLIGPDTLELLCALIRLDCASAAAIRLLDRPKAGTADLAILPAVASTDCIDAGLAKARRVLAPLGSIILRFGGMPSPGLVRHARQALQMHGFQAIHARQLGHQCLLTAELPLVGRLACT